MSAKLRFKTKPGKPTKPGKGSSGTRKRARGSPPRPESGAAYGVFRACGVDLEDGSDLKAGLLRVLETNPLALMSLICDPKDLAHVLYTLRCDRQEALLALYDAMRVSGEDRSDGILDWDPAKGGLVPYLRKGCHFAALKLCGREERAPWGRTVSLMEEVPDAHEEGRARTLLDILAAKPEPVESDDLKVAVSELATLPEPERLAITWSFGLGDEPRLNHREIGRKLGCTRTRAWEHYTRGMGKLRARLLPARR